MKKITIFFCLIAVARCAQLQQEIIDETSALGGNCRKYPTSYTSGANSYTCSWNAASLQFVCVGGGNTVTYQYPSLRKFIDEIKIPARFFMTAVTSVGASNSTTTMTYDSSDRLATWTTVTGSTTQIYTYSNYDGSGRPQSGLYNITSGGFSCVNASLVRTYNDSARTMSESVSGGTGLICTVFSSTSTYDTVTGFDVVVVASPGGTTTKTINATSQFCM